MALMQVGLPLIRQNHRPSHPFQYLPASRALNARPASTQPARTLLPFRSHVSPADKGEPLIAAGPRQVPTSPQGNMQHPKRAKDGLVTRGNELSSVIPSERCSGTDLNLDPHFRWAMAVRSRKRIFAAARPSHRPTPVLVWARHTRPPPLATPGERTWRASPFTARSARGRGRPRRPRCASGAASARS
jgi:hypothetical protein